MQVRTGEKVMPWVRSKRMIQVNSNWYFVTRERTQEGPFTSLEEAEAELELYILTMKQRSLEELSHLTDKFTSKSQGDTHALRSRTLN